jgi:Na+/phosphate symporter
MKDFSNKVADFFDFVINLLKKRNFEDLEKLVSRRDELIDLANDIFRSRIKIIKKTHKGAKVTATYMEMLVETKNLLLNVVKLVKADFNLLESYTSANGTPREEILD